MEQDARSRESSSGLPPPSLPPSPARVAAPVAAKVAPQVEERRNSSERKASEEGEGDYETQMVCGNEEEIFGANGASNGASEPGQRAAETAPRLGRGLERGTERAVATQAAAESASGFQSELLPMEDIYRAAGITSPRRGYSIGKVVEMLRSEHLRGASRELRRAAGADGAGCGGRDGGRSVAGREGAPGSD